MKRRKIMFSILFVLAIVAAGIVMTMPRALSIRPRIWFPEPVDVFATDQASMSDSAVGTIKLLTVTENEDGPGLQARPVDPATLASFPGAAPINFGQHYTYAVGPDRKTLAVIIWPSGSDNAGGALHLIDLETWTDTPADLRLDNYVGNLTFGAAGKTLYWTIPAAHDLTQGMPLDYQLYRYDLDSRQLSTVVRLPSSFMPWGQQPILPTGKLAIFGVPTDSENLAEDAPHVLIVDLARDRITADMRLDGVKAGQFRENLTNATPPARGESWQYVTYNPGLAWDLENSLLYIVHADEDKVTVVDLAREAIAQQTRLHPQRSFLEWLSASLTLTAQAKGGPELQVRAVLSRDGKRLYVFSQDTETGQLKAAKLRVIATDGMREVSHIDDLLTDFALTPDDKSLLVVKGETVNLYGFDMMVSRDVYVLDAETLQEHAHVRADRTDNLWFDGFSPDGRYAYMNGASAQWVEGSGWRDWRTPWQLLDLNSYRLTSSSDSTGSYAALLHIIP